VRSVREFVLDAAGVLIGATRLLLRHWPVLVCLALAGMAFRGAALWAAVEVSDHVNWLGHGLVILAPLGFLVAMIAMLHLLRNDLPNVARVSSGTAPADATTGRERRLIDVATSMVVPFFAVYVSYGLLTEDVEHFVNEAGADEFNQIDFYGTGEGPDFSRVFINAWYLVAGLVLAAWVLRFALGHAEKRWKFLGFAILGGERDAVQPAERAGYTQQQGRNGAADACRRAGRQPPRDHLPQPHREYHINTSTKSQTVAATRNLRANTCGAGQKLPEPIRVPHRLTRTRLDEHPFGLQRVVTADDVGGAVQSEVQ
jgi:hypothetical protein